MSALDDLQPLVERLRLYGHAQRLLILSLLLEAESSVGELERRSGIGQPSLSQQLAELRRVDAVETRRDGKHVFYRVAAAEAVRVQRILALMQDDAGHAQPVRAKAMPAAPDPAGAVFPRILF